MPSVEDYQKFLNGDLSKDDLKRRLDVASQENPLVDWDAHDRATGMYDDQRSSNTSVGLQEDMALHDRGMARGASVADYEQFLSGKTSITDLRAKIATGYDPLADMAHNDRNTGLYDNQRGLATSYGLDRDQLDHDIATGRLDRDQNVVAPIAAVDPVADMRQHDITTGRDAPTYDSPAYDTPSYSDYTRHAYASDPTRI